MVMQHKLDSVELDELANAAVSDRQIAEELQRFVDDSLTRTPILQVGHTKTNNKHILL